MRETPPDILRSGWIKVGPATYQPLSVFAKYHDGNEEKGREKIANYLELVKEGALRHGNDPLH